MGKSRSNTAVLSASLAFLGCGAIVYAKMCGVCSLGRELASFSSSPIAANILLALLVV